LSLIAIVNGLIMGKLITNKKISPQCGGIDVGSTWSWHMFG